ncbi:MAG: cytochrome c [Acidobacteria bacterium]|nr:cytochrome c [Acidobacteriota bacterium]
MRRHLKLGALLTLAGCSMVPVRAGELQSAALIPRGIPSSRVENSLPDGKALFVESCSSCHWEKGDKPLSTGKPLNARMLKREEIAEAVHGRLKDRTAEQKQGVILYIQSLLIKR